MLITCYILIIAIFFLYFKHDDLPYCFQGVGLIDADTEINTNWLDQADHLIRHIFKHSPHDVIQTIQITPASNQEKIFVISRHNLLMSFDGYAWKRVTQGLDAHKLLSMSVSPSIADDGTIFIASLGGGVYCSNDFGDSWSSCQDKVLEACVTHLAISSNFNVDHTVIALGLSGKVYRSQDRGQKWEIILNHANELPGYIDEQAKAVVRRQYDWSSLQYDAGMGWRDLHEPVGVTCFEFAADGLLLGTSQGKIYKSIDNGSAWEMWADLGRSTRINCLTIPKNGSLKHSILVGTHSSGLFCFKGKKLINHNRSPSQHLGSITSIATLEEDGNCNILVCSKDKAVYRSVDYGQSWLKLDQGLTKNSQADEARYQAAHFNAILAVDRNSSKFTGNVFVGGFDGLFKTNCLSDYWEYIQTLSIGTILGLDLSPGLAGKPLLAITTYNSGAYFYQPGSTWLTVHNKGLQTIRLGTIAFSPNFASDHIIFAATEGYLLRLDYAVGIWERFSLTGGKKKSLPLNYFFNLLRKFESQLAQYLDLNQLNRLKGLYKAAMVRTGLKVSYFVFPTVIKFSPGYSTDHRLYVGTREHGIFLSEDAGKSFVNIWNGEQKFIISIAISPNFNFDQTIYASHINGVFISQNAGETWNRITDADQIVNPRVILSPFFPEDETIFITGQGELICSQNKGKTWDISHFDNLTAPYTISSLAISPNFRQDGEILANVYGQGLFKSIDYGKTFHHVAWFDSFDHIDFSHPLCFPDANSLIRYSPNYRFDQTIGLASGDSIWISHDKGNTWKQLHKKIRYEDLRKEIEYQGKWRIEKHVELSAFSAHWSNRCSDCLKFLFFGTGITWIGSRGPDRGIAQVFLDGDFITELDLYQANLERSKSLFELLDLPQKNHEIIIRIGNDKNPMSRGFLVSIDAFDVMT